MSLSWRTGISWGLLSLSYQNLLSLHNNFKKRKKICKILVVNQRNKPESREIKQQTSKKGSSLAKTSSSESHVKTTQRIKSKRQLNKKPDPRQPNRSKVHPVVQPRMGHHPKSTR
jgi:tRNA A22 N-methylase